MRQATPQAEQPESRHGLSSIANEAAPRSAAKGKGRAAITSEAEAPAKEKAGPGRDSVQKARATSFAKEQGRAVPTATLGMKEPSSSKGKGREPLAESKRTHAKKQKLVKFRDLDDEESGSEPEERASEGASP